MGWDGSIYYRLFTFLFASLGLKNKLSKIFSGWTFLILINVHFAFYHRSLVLGEFEKWQIVGFENVAPFMVRR
jgi:hypothetical protein